MIEVTGIEREPFFEDMSGMYNEVVPASISRNTKKNGKQKNKKDLKREGGAQSVVSGDDKSPHSASPGDWPSELHQFVTECFKRSNIRLNESQKPLFNHQLHSLISRASAMNVLFENDWSKQKLPILDGTKKLQLEFEQRRALELAGFGVGQKESLSQSKPIQESVAVQPSGSTLLDYNKLKRKPDFESKARKMQRMQRFEAELPQIPPTSRLDLSGPNGGKSTAFVGTSQVLERNYLRLTSDPVPGMVRPQGVLIKSIDLVLRKYNESKSYSYFISQLKSIRQDLTVQHIKNDFTIYVYETNAKISLQNRDLGEFNQCQSQLKYLYYLTRKSEEGKLDKKFYRCELEFLVLRTIYMIITNNYSEVYKIKLQVRNYDAFKKTKKEQIWFGFLHDLFALNQALLLGNYHIFFQLLHKFEAIKEISLGYWMILNHILEKTRVKALSSISKGYRTISSEVVMQRLNFKDDSELSEFLSKYKLGQYHGDGFDCMGARTVLSAILNGGDFKKVDIKGQL